MSDFKYLSDGRKVVVIGQLNNTESIVQEVFVTESGDELPSGERFTTKSLHDEPVKSWAEKQKQKHEDQIAYVKEQQELENKRLIDIRQKLKGYQETFKQVSKLAETLDDQQLEELTLFMSGAVEYVVVSSSYELIPPKRFDEEIFYYDRNYKERRFDGLSLVTFLGKSNGDTEYHVNRWSDGSGAQWKEVKPFADWDSAFEYFLGIVDSKIADKKFSMENYKVCKKAGVNFTPEQMQQIRDIVLASKKQSLANAEASAEKNIQSARDALRKAEEELNQ